VKCEQIDWYIIVFTRETKLMHNTKMQQDAFLKAQSLHITSKQEIINSGGSTPIQSLSLADFQLDI
jgi:hypothetical protein